MNDAERCQVGMTLCEWANCLLDKKIIVVLESGDTLTGRLAGVDGDALFVKLEHGSVALLTLESIRYARPL